MTRSILCFLLVATAASAQDPMPGSMPDAAEMESALAAMKAQSARPGDEALSCDQLQAEVVAIVQDPEFQSVIQSQGAWAQDQMAKMQDAESGAMKPSGASIAGQIAKGLAMSLLPANPVAGYAQMAASAAQNQAMAAEARKNQQAVMENAQKMMTLMPQILRAAHVVELAQGKSCEFVAEPPAG